MKDGDIRKAITVVEIEGFADGEMMLISPPKEGYFLTIEGLTSQIIKDKRVYISKNVAKEG